MGLGYCVYKHMGQQLHFTFVLILSESYLEKLLAL